MFSWMYAIPINVTNENFTENLENKIAPEEKKSTDIIFISSPFIALILLIISCGVLCRFYKQDVADPDCIEIATIEEYKTEFDILFFQDYDDEMLTVKTKKEVEVLKHILLLLFNCLFQTRAPKRVKLPLFSNIKLIECKLSSILQNVQDFFKGILHQTDDRMKKILLIDPKITKEDDNSLENLLFFDMKGKFGSQCLTVRLPTSSKCLKRDCQYYLPDNLINLCIDLGSCFELDTPESERKLRKLLPPHVITNLELVHLYEHLQETVNMNSQTFKQSCLHFARSILRRCPINPA